MRRKADTAPKLSVQHIRIDAHGYDPGGVYWGAGLDVFIVATADASEEVTVRARNATEAKTKAAAEFAGTTAEPREPLGGHPRRRSRFEIDWRNDITGATVRIRVTHERDYLCADRDHIEIESVRPARALLPITETGYRSHFLAAEDIIAAGSAVRVVETWLKTAAAAKPWRQAQLAAAQGDLFRWAAAKAEVAAKRRKARRPETKAGAKSVKKAGRPPRRGRDPG